MKSLWFNTRSYMWTDYRQKMMLIVAFLVISGCFCTNVYGKLEGEIRLSRGKEIGEYLGGF
jgi:hypothetical protein